MTGQPRTLAVGWVLTLLLALGGCTQLGGDAPLEVAKGGHAKTYRNPLEPRIPAGGPVSGIVESCADPSVIYGQEGEGTWYMYCTSDPLNDEDRSAEGFNFRLIPTLKSRDLVNWTYVGDAFESRPDYAAPGAGIWAPEIEYFSETGQYYLYYTVTETTLPGGGSAIGVATSDKPTGPWDHSDVPAVEPHGADCCGPDSRRWVFDPEVLQTPGGTYIYYGSYFGGLSVRKLSEDGLTSDPATQENVAVANKFEGPEVVRRGGYYYLFASATDCCRGPLTGYSVFVGRSKSPTGPFFDRDGVDLNDNETPDDPTDARVGGTPVLTMNGNRWVGTGHNTVFKDFSGQWWTIYHAIDRTDPYFEGGVNIFPGGCGAEEAPAVPDRCGDLNKRPALLDPIDWVGGWPVVRGGYGPSEGRQPAPAAQPGQRTKYRAKFLRDDRPGRHLDGFSDGFRGDDLGDAWRWVREDGAEYAVEGGVFRFQTQPADLFVTNNTASVLTRRAPRGNYVVETRVRLNVPLEGCCFNFVQAGLVIYGDDDNYVKLVNASIFNTRQTEFAKELKPVPAGYPRYGNTVVGAPGEWTRLRIVKRSVGGEEHYTAYTRREVPGSSWVRGGTWTHELGEGARIGLVSMGGEGFTDEGEPFTAEFDYVRVFRLRPGSYHPWR
jgi:arabinan endo-1,5-alpha-L-arabinosidase